MADRNINQNATQIYGPHASSQIRIVVVGLVPEFDPALLLLAGQIDDATSVLAQTVSKAQSHDAGTRKVALTKSAERKAGLDVLTRFSGHLRGYPKGMIDRKTFFPRNGTVDGVGRSASRVLLGLKHLRDELSKKDCPVHDRTRWLNEVGDAIAALGPLVERATQTRTGRRLTTPEVKAAHTEWLRIYRAARCAVEAVLRLSDKQPLLRVVFYDLAVPAGQKPTEPLPELQAA